MRKLTPLFLLALMMNDKRQPGKEQKGIYPDKAFEIEDLHYYMAEALNGREKEPC